MGSLVCYFHLLTWICGLYLSSMGRSFPETGCRQVLPHTYNISKSQCSAWSMDTSLGEHTVYSALHQKLTWHCAMHVQCKRLVTVREAARAQGYPDSFEFCGKNDSPRQVYGFLYYSSSKMSSYFCLVDV